MNKGPKVEKGYEGRQARRKAHNRGRHQAIYTRTTNSDGYPKGCFGSSLSQKAAKRKDKGAATC